jgi:RNA polymerase primary sigma factor
MHTPSSDEVVVQRMRHRHTQRALASLTSQEAIIISRHFGLEDRAVETLEQIGRDFHLSHERVRQIVTTALAKLKRYLVSLEH